MSHAKLDPSAVPVLRERIFDVLKDADLSVISAKKIRIALSELPEGSLPEGVDLVDHKKSIDEVIRGCYDEVTKKGVPENKITLPGAGGVPGDASKERSQKRKTTEAPKKTTKKRSKENEDEEPKKKRAPNPNSPLNRPMRLSPAMAEVCGGNEVSLRCLREMPRHGVVKQLWAYIKERNLQNESNKRQVCTSRLHTDLDYV